MRKFTLMFSLVLVACVLIGCGKGADYTTAEFEQALRNGDSVEGKTVAVEVVKMEAQSAFGYNIQAGDHLNFVSAENPKVKAGDTIKLEVERVASLFGSFIITYKK